MSTKTDNASSIQKLLKEIFENNNSNIDRVLSKLKYADIVRQVILYLCNQLQNSKSKNYEFYEKVYTIAENIYVDNLKLSPSIKNSKIKNKIDDKKYKPSNLKKSLGKLWITLLRSTMPEKLLIQATLALGDDILERVGNISSMVDIIISIFERNHALGVSSLRAVLHLMRYEQIEYLNVYDIIMGLLDERLFTNEHCIRFFDDLDVFLSSKNLSHQKAADFAKRLSELCQSSASVEQLPMLLKLIVNILKRHPQSQRLVHVSQDEIINNSQAEPQNKLIEVKALQNHFDAEVRTLAEQINYKLNDKEDVMPPSTSVALKTKRIKLSKEKIEAAIDCFMNSNSSLPQLSTIEYFGTFSSSLFQ